MVAMDFLEAPRRTTGEEVIAWGEAGREASDRGCPNGLPNKVNGAQSAQLSD